MRHIATKRGLRLVQHGVLISDIRSRPGPTHTLYDVVAALAWLLSPGPRLALLGFAGGGLLAPLRAQGCPHAVWAVDIDPQGYASFQRLCAPWAGLVHWQQAEASAWLAGQRRTYDLIMEDLSVAQDGDVWKPEVSWTILPGLVKRRLGRGGVGLFNLLRPASRPWAWAVDRVTCGFAHRLVVTFEDYENRLVLASDRPLPAAARLSRQSNLALRNIASRMAGRSAVRSW